VFKLKFGDYSAARPDRDRYVSVTHMIVTAVTHMIVTAVTHMIVTAVTHMIVTAVTHNPQT
jgi:hypothetical protein